MQPKRKELLNEQTYREPGSKIEELPGNTSLVKFFEILIRIDQRLKQNGKNN